MRKILLITILCILCVSVLNAALTTKARIIPVKGTLRYKVGNGEYKETAKAVTVNGKVWIDTGKNGYAKIKFPPHQGSEIKLQPETMIRLQGKSVYIKMGKSWFKVERSMKGLIIKTPTAIAGIRGTIFEVDVKKNRTDFYVFEGRVYVVKRISKLTTDVEQSFKTVIEPSVISEKEKFSITKRNDNFWNEVNWNKMYLKQLEKLKKGYQIKDFNNSFKKIKKAASGIPKKLIPRYGEKTKVTVDNKAEKLEEEIEEEFEEETETSVTGTNVESIFDKYK